jgi:tetratricopeptide (TPR) repeat protein
MRVKMGHSGRMTRAAAPEDNDRTLRSWKEIASYFGRDERTVKRWEAKGLPVHRMPGMTRGSVYAQETELKAWLQGGSDLMAAEPPAEPLPPDPVPARREPLPSQGFPYRTGALLAAVGLLMAAGVAAGSFGTARQTAPQEAARLSTDSRAREAYLQATYHIDLRTAAGIELAIHKFTEAITLDPGFAAAYAGLAKAYNLISLYASMSPELAFPLAKAAAERAIAIDPTNASAFGSLAFNAVYWDRDFDLAESLFATSLKFDPRSSDVRHWRAIALLQNGRIEEAAEELDRAQTLDPGSRVILATKSLIRYHNGDTREAIEILRSLVADAPTYTTPHVYLSDIYFAEGHYTQAIVHGREAARVNGSAAARAVWDAAADGLDADGERGMLERMISVQRTYVERDAYPAFDLARTLARLGRDGEAVRYANQAVTNRERRALFVKIDPVLRHLHDRADFQAVLARAGHGPAANTGPMASISEESSAPPP